jgi:hypothetical protein
MPREVLEYFGVDFETVAARFDGAYYFPARAHSIRRWRRNTTGGNLSMYAVTL